MGVNDFIEHNADKAIHHAESRLTEQDTASSPLGQDAQKFIAELNAVQGMTQASSRDLKRSRRRFDLPDGTQVRDWKNPVGVYHVFLADKNGGFLYGGFVGWTDTEYFVAAINRKEREVLAGLQR